MLHTGSPAPTAPACPRARHSFCCSQRPGPHSSHWQPVWRKRQRGSCLCPFFSWLAPGMVARSQAACKHRLLVWHDCTDHPTLTRSAPCAEPHARCLAITHGRLQQPACTLSANSQCLLCTNCSHKLAFLRKAANSESSFSFSGDGPNSVCRSTLPPPPPLLLCALRANSCVQATSC